MVITLNGTGIDLTDAIKRYAEEKIMGLTKYFDNIIKAEIDVGVTTHHHHKGQIYFAEVNLHIPGHNTLRVAREEEDLYKAIDKVKSHLKVELDRIKGKMREIDKATLREHKSYAG